MPLSSAKFLVPLTRGEYTCHGDKKLRHHFPSKDLEVTCCLADNGENRLQKDMVYGDGG